MRLPDIFTKKYHRSIIKCKRLVSVSAFIPCIIQKKAVTADMRMHNICCACGGQLLCTNYYSDL